VALGRGRRLALPPIDVGVLALAPASGYEGPPGEFLPSVILWFLQIATTVAAWAGAVVRLVRARSPQRQQQAWLVLVVLPFAVYNMARITVSSYVVAESNPSYPTAMDVVGFLPQFLAPVAVAVGVLRYRLLGIESVLRRGLVYGTLTVLVFAVYVGVSAVAGQLLAGETVPGLVGTAPVALGPAPLRDRLQRVADRIVHGERHDPMRAVTRLAQRVATTGEPELLPQALAAVAEARCGRLVRRSWEQTGASSPGNPSPNRGRLPTGSGHRSPEWGWGYQPPPTWWPGPRRP
jgi:hypothetical protein